jgi:hypothetical protein
MSEMDTVVSAYRNGGASMPFAEVPKSADELHGPLKPLIAKDEIIRVLARNTGTLSDPDGEVM